MTQATPFDRLVRFENEAGTVLYGEVTAETPTANDLIGSKVDIYEGDGPWSADFKRTSNQDTIAKVSFDLLSSLQQAFGCRSQDLIADRLIRCYLQYPMLPSSMALV
jgi:hypothetical protein